MPACPVARGQPPLKRIIHSAQPDQTPMVCRAHGRSREHGFQERRGPHCQGASIQWERPVMNKWTNEIIPESE